MDAVNRIFRCLEALDAAERPMSLIELQREVLCPTSSLAAALHSLVQMGYVHHDRSSRSYAPTVQLAELGGWVASRFAPAASLVAAANEISRRAGVNVGIAHRNDIRVQYLHHSTSKDAPPLPIRVGTTRLLCRSGLGWALMSFLTPRAIQSIVRRTNQVLAAEDSVEPDLMLSIVEGVRQQGYVHSQHTLRTGYAVIAMPFLSSKNQLAIGATGPAEMLKSRETEIAALMTEVLGKIED